VLEALEAVVELQVALTVTNQHFQRTQQAVVLALLIYLLIPGAMVVQVVELMEVGLIMAALGAQTVEMVVVPDLHQAGQDKELQPKLQ
jgi:hypothetical protein